MAYQTLQWQNARFHGARNMQCVLPCPVLCCEMLSWRVRDGPARKDCLNRVKTSEMDTIGNTLVVHALQVIISKGFLSHSDTETRAVLAPYQNISIDTLANFPARLMGADIRQKILSHSMYGLAACVRMHEAEEAALETIVAIEQGSAALAQWLQGQLRDYSTAAGSNADQGASVIQCARLCLLCTSCVSDSWYNRWLVALNTSGCGYRGAGPAAGVYNLRGK